MEKTKENEKEIVLLLANRIELLFKFCSDLIPDIDLLEKASKGTSDNVSFSASAAPILEAVGIDYEDKQFEWQLKHKRAKALENLVKTLRDTELERSEHNKKKQANAKARAEISRMMGL